VGFVDVQAAGFAATVGPRLAQPGGDGNSRPAQAARGDLELVPLGDGCLVDVAGEDQLGARVDERGEYVAAPCDRLLARAPGGADQVVVEDDDPKRAAGRIGEQLGGPLQLPGANTARLVPPRPHRVEADDEEAVALMDGLRRLPVALELAERVCEAGRERPRDVVVARDDEKWPFEPLQKRRRAVVLARPCAVCQIAAGDDQFGVDALDQGAQRMLDVRLLDGADMQVREVEEPCWHRRSRLVH